MGRAKILISIMLYIFLIFSSESVFAKHHKRRSPSAPVDFSSILKAIAQTYGVNLEQLETAKNEMDQLQRTYDLNEKQLKQSEEIRSALTGKNNYGQKDFKSYGNAWLTDGSNVNDLIDAYTTGNGLVGSIAKNREKEFPIELDTLTNARFNKTDIDYYRLSAKTALSTRAASEAEFSRIEHKLRDQELLQKSIDDSHNLKSSVDLLVRMQSEGNKIMLENLRMLSVLTQQSAIVQQADVNARIQNAKFLSH